MIKKMYIDNYGSFSNFSIHFHKKSLMLFLGQNGAGKSSLFYLLNVLKAFVGGEKNVSESFKKSTLTRWIDKEKNSTQTFEFEIESKEGIYRYELVIEHDIVRNLSRMHKEKLHFNQKTLFEFSIDDSGQGVAELHRDDGSPGPKFPFDWSRSGIGFLTESKDNKRLMRFRDYIRNLTVVQINPYAISAFSEKEENTISYYAENFASFYRYVSQEFQDIIFEYTKAMRKVMPEFLALRLKTSGDMKTLYAAFSAGDKKEILYRFDELSEGQKALFVLYFLIKYNPEDSLLCIDEPENFLALPEVGYWIKELDNRTMDQIGLQVFLISHHPKIIDYLAKEMGVWFYREDINSPTRYKDIASDTADDYHMAISELINRGWIE